MEKGIEKGMEKGMEKKSIDVALQLLSKGMSLVVISEVTGLPVEEIKKLSNDVSTLFRTKNCS